MRKVLLTAMFMIMASYLFSQGTLVVTVQSSQNQVCPGEAVELNAIAQGGNPDDYTFNWSSEPSDPSLTSVSEATVFVSPEFQTVYTVHVSDGIQEASDNETISMNPVPDVTLGIDTSVCAFDSILLDAGPATAYHWSDGCCQRFTKVGSTGLGYDFKTVWVEVENSQGCLGTDTITVYFGYAQCTGIGERDNDESLMVYPNPNHGHFSLAMNDPSFRKGEIRVFSMDGRCVWSQTYEPSGYGLKTDLDLSVLGRGIFLLRIVGDDKSYDRRIVILD